MSRAVIVPFFRPHPRCSLRYKALEGFFKRHYSIWGGEIDKLYVIDSGWNMDMSTFGEKGVCLRTNDLSSHWANLNHGVGSIQEDHFLIMDNDTVIYQEGTLDGIFSRLENDGYDIASMTDTSGFLGLHEKYPFFAENQYRAHRERFAPYLFATSRTFFNSIGDFDFTPLPPPRSTDSMGTVSEQLIKKNPRIYELPDDRSSAYLQGDQVVFASNLDAPHFEWSKTYPNNYGYYHIRNWTGSLLLIDSRWGGKDDYRHHLKIMPTQEMMRLLGWLWYMSDDATLHNEIMIVAQEKGVSAKQWHQYIHEFLEFHSYLKELIDG